MKDIINKLIMFGWVPAPYTQPNDEDYYLWKVFEISKSNELYNYIDYVPEDDELIYALYEVYPNIQKTRYCIWSTNYETFDVIYELDDYNTVLELVIEDKLFTYPRQNK